MYNLQDLYAIILKHSLHTGNSIENYIDNIYIVYDYPIDPSILKEGLIDIKNGHFTVTTKGFNSLALPVANWDTFNLQMMSDARFNQVYNQCLSVAPIVCSALPTALDQVTTKGLSLFALIWTQLCHIGGATTEDKLIWGEYAVVNNLPNDFIEVLTR